MSFILDSSVALSWCFNDEQTPETIRVLNEARRRVIFVPALWHIEVSNILGIAHRKGRINDTELTLALKGMSTLEIHTDLPAVPPAPGILLPIMKTHRLTAYDAVYFELAQRLRLPLATLDSALALAARNFGIPLVIPVP